MKLIGISKEGMKRIAKKIKAQSGSYEEVVKSIAEDIREDFAEGDLSAEEMIGDYIEHSMYTDDYQNCLNILVNSPNASDDGTPIASGDLQFDDQEGWPSLIKQIAKKIMEADVYEVINDMGYDGEGFYDGGSFYEPSRK